jgi:hypothetical protein
MTHSSARHLLLAAALASFPAERGAAQAADDGAIVIPRGRPVLPDGRVDESEWRDAREIAAAPDVRLLVKRDDAHLYVAVVRAQPAVFGVNLYLAADSAADALNLHASAKLGERRGRAGRWPEWVWWNNEGWAANVARGESFAERRFLPDTAKELQIRLDRVPSPVFLLAADVESREGTRPLFPSAPARDGLHWLTLRL